MARSRLTCVSSTWTTTQSSLAQPDRPRGDKPSNRNPSPLTRAIELTEIRCKSPRMGRFRCREQRSSAPRAARVDSAVLLADTILVNGVPARELAPPDVLRGLDATEHNLERLNAKARGSSRTYNSAVIEGPLARASLERALDVLASRYPMLRVRIVQNGNGTLAYAPTRGSRDDGTAHVPVSYTPIDDLSTWPAIVEADMNAGAIASGSGPLFAFGVIEPRGLDDGASGRRVLVMAGHHGVCDAISCFALLHELLEQLAHAHPLQRLEDQPLSDPFCLDRAVPELAEIEAEAASALADRSDQRRQRLEALVARLEQLETHLLTLGDGAGRFPSALKGIHGWLSSVVAELLPAAGIVPETAIEAGVTRYEHARTAFQHLTLGVETTQALQRAARQHAMTLHGVLLSAALLALATEQRERVLGLEPSSSPPERFAIASAVSLRRQLVPPLSPHDLRMAVDVVVSRIVVEPGARFWEIARRAGDDVTQAVAKRRALSSYFRTKPRDFGDTPAGIPIPLVSNLGRAGLRTQYGPLRVLELIGAMTAHGSFQLAMLSVTFDERLSLSFYCETPTVSRAKLERFSARVFDVLTRVARGEEPNAPG